MMLVAVTGGSGHIGAALVRALVERGHRVRVLEYDEAPTLAGLAIDRVPGDVTRSATLPALVQGVERVFHLAGLISLEARDRERMWQINVEGTRNVVAACRQAQVRRLIHFSSIHALSPHPIDYAVDEGRPLVADEPVPAYDRSKAAGDRLVAAAGQAGLDTVTLHPTGVVGPYDYRPSYFGTVLLDLYRGRLPGVVEGGFDWVDVRDVVAAAIAAAERTTPSRRYLLSGRWATIAELARMTAALGGRPAPQLRLPLWLASALAPFSELLARCRRRPSELNRASLHALCNHRDVRSDRARAELGFRPRPLSASIADALADFRGRGLIA